MVTPLRCRCLLLPCRSLVVGRVRLLWLLRSRPTCHGIRRTVIDIARESLVFHFFCIILRLDPCRTGPFLITDLAPTSSRLIGLMTRTPSHHCLLILYDKTIALDPDHTYGHSLPAHLPCMMDIPLISDVPYNAMTHPGLRR